VTKQKHLKRRIRERMRKTGESYTTARLHLLRTPSDAPEESRARDSDGPRRVQLRARQRSLNAPPPPGLRYVVPAFGMVVLILIGAAGFMVAAFPQPSSADAPAITGRPT
jgi:hypothetical protein